MRSPWRRTKSAGSAPAIVRWPVSRQSAACDAASTRSISGSRSTSVPGMRMENELEAEARDELGQPRRGARRACPTPRRRAARGSAQSSSITTAATNTSAPAAASTRPISLGPLARGPRHPARAARAARSRRRARARGAGARARRAPGSSGSQSTGPSSVARKPSAAISLSTRSGGSIRPQPGTSQTPHEIGAAATATPTGGRQPPEHRTLMPRTRQRRLERAIALPGIEALLPRRVER